jgi:Spy/CpxP family protein refolding chaperone
MMYRLMCCVVVGAMMVAVPALAQPVSDANMEILKEKLKADKKLLIASNMDLTDAEAKQFWPLYDAYQKELEAINKQLGQTIKDYAEAFNKGTIPNDTAKKLLNDALSVEEQEVKLKRSHAEKLGKVLPATKVARYIQLETKIRSLIKFEMAQQIPLVY